MSMPREASTSPLSVLIVGAGLSGLSASISCALAGHNVRVVEAAKELVEVGAGLQITPNACRLLQQWDIYELLEPKAAKPTVLQVRRYSDGKVLSRIDDLDYEMQQKYHAPIWNLHRADLQKALADRAQALGVELLLGARVDDVEFDRPSLRLHDGRRLSADLIVGADGLWSKCRECFLRTKGTEDSPLATGDLAYRIVLGLEDVDDQELRELISKPRVQFWLGPRAHVVAYSVRDGQMINIVLLAPDDLPSDVSRQAGSLEEMRAIFRDWDPTLNRFLDHVKSVDKWKLMHRPELESWISDDSTFVFIGDACHPMLPYLAQGANLSMEDGAVLGNILAAVESTADLPRALRLFELLRKKRGEAVARETFATREVNHLPDGPEQRERDDILLAYLGNPIDRKFPIRWQCPEVQPWLFGYDAKGETDGSLESWKTDPRL